MGKITELILRNPHPIDYRDTALLINRAPIGGMGSALVRTRHGDRHCPLFDSLEDYGAPTAIWPQGQEARAVSSQGVLQFRIRYDCRPITPSGYMCRTCLVSSVVIHCSSIESGEWTLDRLLLSLPRCDGYISFDEPQEGSEDAQSEGVRRDESEMGQGATSTANDGMATASGSTNLRSDAFCEDLGQ